MRLIMKRDKEQLIEDYKRLSSDYKELCIDYPYWYDNGKFYERSPLPDTITEKYDFLEKRLKNLKININQATMREINN